MSKHARAIANANIALAKYWGKSDETLNLPAVPSVSLTLAPLRTETEVTFDPALKNDLFELDGMPASEKERTRVSMLLDQVRQKAHLNHCAHVRSINHFPTAAGLASSASGFAALAGAATAAAGLDPSPSELSALARQASASAARSIFGGIVELPEGTPGDASLSAHPVADADHWDLRVIVAVTAKGRKSIGSREAMNLSRDHSPYYDAWIERSAILAPAIKTALLERNFERLAPAVEESFLAMHAVAMTSRPSVLYWNSASLGVIEKVRAWRDEGLGVCATMDAGPHVKCITLAQDAERVLQRLRNTEGVLEVLETTIGAGIQVER